MIVVLNLGRAWIPVGVGLIFLANQLGKCRVRYVGGKRVERYSSKIETFYAWSVAAIEAMLITFGEWRNLFIIWWHRLDGRTAEEAMLAAVMTAFTLGVFVGWIAWWVARHSEITPIESAQPRSAVTKTDEIAERMCVLRTVVETSRTLQLVSILPEAGVKGESHASVVTETAMVDHPQQPDVTNIDWSALVKPVSPCLRLSDNGLHLERVDEEVKMTLEEAQAQYEANLARIQRYLMANKPAEESSTKPLLERLAAEGKVIIQLDGRGKDQRVVSITARSKTS